MEEPAQRGSGAQLSGVALSDCAQLPDRPEPEKKDWRIE
jgi:hypothetical protein